MLRSFISVDMPIMTGLFSLYPVATNCAGADGQSTSQPRDRSPAVYVARAHLGLSGKYAFGSVGSFDIALYDSAFARRPQFIRLGVSSQKSKFSEGPMPWRGVPRVSPARAKGQSDI